MNSMFVARIFLLILLLLLININIILHDIKILGNSLRIMKDNFERAVGILFIS